MRGHFSGVRAAVVGVVVLAGLVVVGSAVAATISSFSPTSGLPAKDNGEACPGNTITINGSGFVSDNPTVVAGSPTGVVSVFFGGVKSTYVVVGSNTIMYAVVPDGAVTGPISVTTGAGSTTATGTFYVNPCPQISLKAALAGQSTDAGVSTPTIYKVKPSSGKVGATIDITGSNMLHVRGVLFGTTKAKFTISTPTHIIAIVPKGAKTAKIYLTYSIGASTSQGGVTPTNAAGNSSSALSAQVSPNTFKVTT
jgi:IPT/TIG domain